MKPDIIIDYMQADIDGVITVETAKLPDGTKVSGHIVVGDDDAEPAVARILEVGPERTAIRILPGSAEDNADLLDRPYPTLTG
jgi:NADPH-dependent ferric siderophore reductase